MRVTLQLVMWSDDGRGDTVTDLVTLQKDSTRPAHLGWSLKAAKQLLTTIQHRMLQQPVEAFLASHSTCADCGAPRKVKGYPLNVEQFGEGRRWCPWARGGLKEAHVFAGDQPCNGEETHPVRARFDALQQVRNGATSTS
jgi:hypothetical protein